MRNKSRVPAIAVDPLGRHYVVQEKSLAGKTFVFSVFFSFEKSDLTWERDKLPGRLDKLEYLISNKTNLFTVPEDAVNLFGLWIFYGIVDETSISLIHDESEYLSWSFFRR